MCVTSGQGREPVCGSPCSLFPLAGSVPGGGCSVIGDPGMKTTQNRATADPHAYSHMRNKIFIILL